MPLLNEINLFKKNVVVKIKFFNQSKVNEITKKIIIFSVKNFN
jgi:hypothetical protein